MSGKKKTAKRGKRGWIRTHRKREELHGAIGGASRAEKERARRTAKTPKVKVVPRDVQSAVGRKARRLDGNAM